MKTGKHQLKIRHSGTPENIVALFKGTLLIAGEFENSHRMYIESFSEKIELSKEKPINEETFQQESTT